MVTGDRVLVTGASSGIGEACALRLARAGRHVLAGVRTDADGDRLREQAGGAIEPVRLDVTDSGSIGDAAEQLGMSRATGYRMWTYARAWLRAAVQELDRA